MQPAVLERISQASKQRIDLNLSLGPMMLPVSIKRQKSQACCQDCEKWVHHGLFCLAVKPSIQLFFPRVEYSGFEYSFFPHQVLKYRTLNCKMLTLACK